MFNEEIEEQHMKAFSDNYNLESLLKSLYVTKNLSNCTCIDLILTNVPKSF